MIQITDPRLNADKERNVELVYQLLLAAEKDHAASPVPKKKRLSRRGWDAEISDAFPGMMDNQTPLQTAVRTFNVKAKGSNSNPSTLSGPDVYRVVRFFLRNKAGWGWNNFRQVLKSAGSPYDELLALESDTRLAPEVEYDILANQRVGDIVGPEVDPGTRLRELADTFDHLQTSLRLANTDKRILTEEMATIRRQINAVTVAFGRIQKTYRKAPDSKKEELQQLMDETYKMLASLRGLV